MWSRSVREQPRPLTSPLGGLLDDLRRRPGRVPGGPQQPRPIRAARDPGLRLEIGVVSRAPVAPGRRALLSLSLVLHACLLGAGLVVPALLPQALPAPAGATRVFLTLPLAAPPPPAPLRPRVAAPVRQAALRSPGVAAPVETPERIVPEESLELGGSDGELGGVEGGVPGGVVGAVVPALPAQPPPAPVRVGGQIHEPLKLRNVDPVYPEVAVRAGIEGIVILECQLSPAGKVVEVKVLRGLPLLTEAAVEAVRQWLYSPTLLDGVPVAVVMPVTVRFALDTGRSPRAR
jgi:protein TonB